MIYELIFSWKIAVFFYKKKVVASEGRTTAFGDTKIGKAEILINCLYNFFFMLATYFLCSILDLGLIQGYKNRAPRKDWIHHSILISLRD